MSPRKYEFATEQVEEWVRKRRRKASFSQLGKEYGVDRRVIARAVRKVEASGEDQGAPARLQLTTEFLREHVEEIQTAAAYLLEVMAADALGARFPVGDESVEPMLVKQLRDRYAPTRPTGGRLSPAKELQLQVGVRLAERRAKAVVQGLRDHLPEVWRLVRKWEEAREEVREGVREGVRSGCGYWWGQLHELAARRGMRPDWVGPSVRMALELLPNQEQYEEEIGEEEPPKPMRNISQAAKGLLQVPLARRALKEFQAGLLPLRDIYEQLEEVTAAPRLRKALLTSRCKNCPGT